MGEFMKSASRLLLKGVGLLALLSGPAWFALHGKPVEAGIVIASSVLFRVFIDLDRFESFGAAGVTAKLRKVAAKAEATTAKAEATIESMTEPVPEEAKKKRTKGVKTVDHAAPEGVEAMPSATQAQADQQAVLGALVNSAYTWRYIKGVTLDSGLPSARAAAALEELAMQRMVHVSEGKFGTIWAPSSLGRKRWAEHNPKN